MDRGEIAVRSSQYAHAGSRVDRGNLTRLKKQMRRKVTNYGDVSITLFAKCPETFFSFFTLDFTTNCIF